MKFSAVFVTLCFCVIMSRAQTSIDLLKKMYDHYHGKWHNSLKFDQTTERYRNDSLISTAIWFETIVYPDLLRVDIGKPKSDNGILLRHDSTYVFRNNSIVKSIPSANELIFFLGGLYFMPFDSVKVRFKELHYDLSKYHASTWQGKPVYVIGANTDGEKVNQLWVDSEKLVTVRFIKYDNNTKEEGMFADQVALKGGWSETNTRFYRNDKLLQVEEYHHLSAGEPVNKIIFEPSALGK